MLKRIFFGILLNAIALYVVTLLFKDITYSGELKFFIVAGVIIGILNTFIKPLMKFLSLPLVFCSFGLVLLLINTIIFWLTVQIINAINYSGISINVGNSFTYFLGAIVFAVVNWTIHLLIKNK